MSLVPLLLPNINSLLILPSRLIDKQFQSPAGSCHQHMLHCHWEHWRSLSTRKLIGKVDIAMFQESRVLKEPNVYNEALSMIGSTDDEESQPMMGSTDEKEKQPMMEAPMVRRGSQ